MAVKRTGDPTVLLFAGEVTHTPDSAATVMGTSTIRRAAAIIPFLHFGHVGARTQ